MPIIRIDAPFDKGEFLQFTGDGRAWLDFNFGVGALRLGATSPDLINLNATNIRLVAFNGVNIAESVDLSLEINHNWAEETTIYPHVHWMPTTSASGNVKWQLEYVLVNRTETGVVGASSTTISAIQAAGGVAWAPKFLDLPVITATGLLIGTQALVRFFRDPNDGDDDYGADAAVMTVGFHVLVDSLGSSQIASK